MSTDFDKKASGSSIDLSFFTDNFKIRLRSSLNLNLLLEANRVIRGGSLLEAPNTCEWLILVIRNKSNR